MTVSPLVLVGGGALARVLVDMFGREAFAALYVDPGFAAEPIAGLPVLRDWADARRHGGQFLLGLADLPQRRRLAQAAQAAGLRPAAPMVSPHAVLAADARLGPGCVVGHHSVVGPGAELQAQVLVMHGVAIGHDVQVQDNCVVCAGAVLGGWSLLGPDSFVGLNATVTPRVHIAGGSFVAAGAVCLRSTDRASLLLGNPARAQPRTTA